MLPISPDDRAQIAALRRRREVNASSFTRTVIDCASVSYLPLGQSSARVTEVIPLEAVSCDKSQIL